MAGLKAALKVPALWRLTNEDMRIHSCLPPLPHRLPDLVSFQSASYLTSQSASHSNRLHVARKLRPNQFLVAQFTHHKLHGDHVHSLAAHHDLALIARIQPAARNAHYADHDR